MKEAKSKLVRVLERRLRKIGLTYDSLCDASEIVVFGSHAAREGHRGSDIDVLLVGRPGRINRGGLDVISVSSERVMTSQWLGSELASHIAEYGVWRRGTGDWKKTAIQSLGAEIAKVRRLKGLIRALAENWSELHPIFHRRYRKVVRREIQRLNLLRHGFAVPPTAVLDREWKQNRGDRVQFAALAKSLGLTPRSYDFVLKSLLSSCREGNRESSGAKAVASSLSRERQTRLTPSLMG